MQFYSSKKLFKVLRILFPAYVKLLFRPAPIWVHLYVTRKCNLDCNYCFVKNPAKKDLSKKEVKETIDKLFSLGTRFIAFMGGEPTIRKDLTEIIKYARNKGMITYLPTNGTLLTPSYIDKLGKAGIDIINLSVDSVGGFDESKKDYIKIKEVLTNLIKARKKYGFEINVNLVMTKKNVGKAVQTIKLIHGFRIPISVGMIVGNTYNEKPQNKNLFFTAGRDKKKLYRVLDKIKKLKKQKYNIIEPLQYFDDIKKFVNHKLDWYCCAGKYYFSVDCDGKFQICAGLPDENISIFDIDQHYFEKFAYIREKRLAKCKKMCLSNCLYTTSYLIKNPLNIVKELI